MAILNDTIINGDIRGRDPSFNSVMNPPNNFSSMNGIKIISDNVGGINSTGTSYYSYGNLFLGSVCTDVLGASSEILEDNLYYLCGLSLVSTPGGLYLYPCNYNYKTGERYTTGYNCNLGNSSSFWSNAYIKSIHAPASSTPSSSSMDTNTFNITVYPNVYSGSSSSSYQGSRICFDLQNRSDVSSTVSEKTYTLNLETYSTNGLDIYPEITRNASSANKNFRLGTSSHPFTQLYLGSYTSSGSTSYYNYFSSASNGLRLYLSVSGSFYPGSNSTSSTTGYTLGTSSYKWRYLYAYSGTIQSSDRSAKDSIHYLDSSDEPKVAKMSTMSTKSNSISTITTDDVIDFVKNIKPTTFCYYDGSETANEDNSDPEMIQLGLIADDIKDHKLYKYIGVDRTDEVTTDEEKDEEGNVVKESETQSVHTLGLQVLPLTVAALTSCKYLLNQVETLKTEIEELKK